MQKNKEIGLIFKAISHILHNQELIMRNICADKTYAISDTNELSVLSGNLSEAYYKGEEDVDTEVSKIVDYLDTLKKKNPEQYLVVETPQGTVSLKIGEAMIYEGRNGEIVIDNE